ncbi:hypothetical protein CSUNSWCD_403 [Campylobacter showae CSUNSWCD]|uniref:Uncharacterized protein n=1 Tax=Campylobacter showae CSUNSWCD TaxID=1244083 RepID=M5IT93_9BACT|nr:hypothetical protein CSUNSWCD_403 [Campylobacter showae CSUNSWCD]
MFRKFAAFYKILGKFWLWACLKPGFDLGAKFDAVNDFKIV